MKRSNAGSRGPIYSALPIVAAAYGEKFGVQVNLGNQGASTNGKVINLPAIPDDFPHKDALWGYLAHEAGHVRYSEFDVSLDSDLHRNLTNLFEDCRIEREMIGVYPGTAHTLNECAMHMDDAGHYPVPTGDSHPVTVLQAYILYTIQAELVGQQFLLPRAETARSVLRNMFPKGVCTRLDSLMRTTVRLKSTSDASDLARRVIAMLEEERKQQPDPSNPSQDSESDSTSNSAMGNTIQGVDESGPKGRSDQAVDGPENMSVKSNSGIDAETGSKAPRPEHGPGQDGIPDAPLDNDTQGASGAKSRNSTIESPDQSVERSGGNTSNGDEGGKVIDAVLGAGKDDFIGDPREEFRAELLEAASANPNPHYQTIKSAPEIHPNDICGKKLLAESLSASSKIRAQLYGLVQASQRTMQRDKRSGRKINPKRLSRLIVGDSRVFRARSEKVTPNTAVHLIVDMSGSMQRTSQTGSSRAHIAQTASIALATALESIPGVNPAVTYFLGSSGSPLRAVVKHGQPVKTRAGYFHRLPDGSTPMAEAIWYAAYELTKTREDRKMIVVVTDGDPDDGSAVANVIQLCERSGFEMVGVGIESTSVARLITDHVVIHKADDLQKVLFKLIGRSLVDSAA